MSAHSCACKLQRSSLSSHRLPSYRQKSSSSILERIGCSHPVSQKTVVNSARFSFAHSTSAVESLPPEKQTTCFIADTIRPCPLTACPAWPGSSPPAHPATPASQKGSRPQHPPPRLRQAARLKIPCGQ